MSPRKPSEALFAAEEAAGEDFGEIEGAFIEGYRCGLANARSGQDKERKAQAEAADSGTAKARFLRALVDDEKLD